MIHLLILIALGLATYLFHNYQTFMMPICALGSLNM